MGSSVLVAIGLLGLLIIGAVVLLDRRLSALQTELARRDDVAELSRRLRELSAELDRDELSAPLAARITEFAEAERRLFAALAEVRGELSDLRRAAERRAAAEGLPAVPEPPDLGAVVREHLAARGFDRVAILSDLTRLVGREGRVVFEARRDGVMHKGHVGLADGEVVDEDVRAAYSAFP